MKYSLYKFDILHSIRLCLFTGTLFCYYFQFPFKGVSRYIIPSLAVYLILSFGIIIKNINITNLLLISIYYICISIILVVSVFRYIEPGRILRFCIILSVLPLFCFVAFYDAKNKLFKIFIILSMLKALSQVIVYLLILKLGTYVPFRDFVQANDMGDIYPYLNIFMKIQVRGTPLLLFAVMLYFEIRRKYDWIFFLLLTGVLLAGNFAFILGLLCFFIFKVYDYIVANKTNFSIRVSVSLFLLSFMGILLVPFFKNEVEVKSDYSNVVRLEQANALMSGNIILGNGFGNVIEAKGQLTNYSGEIYFELQSLYIINQFGVLGFLYLNFIIFYFLSHSRKNITRLYFLYLLYSFWNPYCFDTTHMMVIAILVNIEIKRGNKYAGKYLRSGNSFFP
ncbi:hypothetical protein TREVI0001_2610 [Treponema vincentii ATCC 35580]|uniref:O-antigen polymerase n=1 Tax=Treponema vincentii ATCC 35580 TaxID=596324 RepID=C8PNI0_9SPIR|nr:hypothetical protein [Treponema vincentii]EEV21085.1 hypothetical protein TREVI0001_2610 [Treponema vincentii ATCC 35580]